MVQTSDIEEVSSSASTPALSTPKRDITDKSPADNDYTNYPTESVAAVTIAVLAVVIVLTMVLVFRALRKRQRARQGEQFGEGHIPTITTGVMGTGASAYASSLDSVPVRGQIRWESINPSSGADNSSQQQPQR
ncbi:uncharacterized protein LOC132749037 [Ruditapes philippinarum]|uniref:uncharacterized protein LOC132749037 n=1 Tax=Ruditapes philippinarum TaxID=129788 RepID=UPI00295BBC93|nr:uncharacterized protein LOC132749037 [Ruditapes philippinarum]XP_060594695.1 uncharacterized protein LOC132749037 [Ruditapes philippinarum]